MRTIFKILAMGIVLGIPCSFEASELYETPPFPLAGKEMAGSDCLKDALLAANSGVEIVFDYQPQNVYKVYTQEGFVTDIRLEPREEIKYIGGGDTLRWKIDTIDSSLVSHVLIKPMQKGISTNLIISTDRRMYQLIVESGNKYNPIVSWSFPKTNTVVVRDKLAINYAALDPLHMDFNYRISDRSYKWSPESVFRSEHKTYFKMRPDIINSELPAFYELDDSNKPILVSYRFLHGHFIVDKVVDKGIFVLGKKQVRVSFKG